MSSTPNGRFLASTVLADFDPIICGFLEDLRARGEITEGHADQHRGPARHFLIWTVLSGIALEEIDGSVIDRFLQHDCDCWSTVSMPRKGMWLRRWRKRKSSPAIMRFVRYLEQTGRIQTPEGLADKFGLLGDFLERLRGEGYASGSIKQYRCSCNWLVVWLHLFRIPLHELTLAVYERFLNSDFSCTIPGEFYCRQAPSPGSSCDMRIRKFLNYLASIGQIEPLEPAPKEKALPAILDRFSDWLECNRGIRVRTINSYARHIEEVLPELGDDPGRYDASLIRSVLLEQLEHRSPERARSLITSMRMYLRFLASEGVVAGTLMNAVPTIRRSRLSSLPRYIPAEDIERTIDSCGNHHAGIRDRAILLLLARLALRAGDVAALRVCDIDWDRAEIRVSGKSRKESALPLPQDVGDALRTYITKARPKAANEDRVFLRAVAPHGSFSNASVVSKVVRRALDRAGINTVGGRGAHVFRHSRATELLRSGASLDAIQHLLRHESLNTTMIYAKTDVAMLLEVVQPWIGGGAEE